MHAFTVSGDLRSLVLVTYYMIEKPYDSRVSILWIRREKLVWPFRICVFGRWNKFCFFLFGFAVFLVKSPLLCFQVWNWVFGLSLLLSQVMCFSLRRNCRKTLLQGGWSIPMRHNATSVTSGGWLVARKSTRISEVECWRNLLPATRNMCPVKTLQILTTILRELGSSTSLVCPKPPKVSRGAWFSEKTTLGWILTTSLRQGKSWGVATKSPPLFKSIPNSRPPRLETSVSLSQRWWKTLFLLLPLLLLLLLLHWGTAPSKSMNTNDSTTNISPPRFSILFLLCEYCLDFIFLLNSFQTSPSLGLSCLAEAAFVNSGIRF